MQRRSRKHILVWIKILNMNLSCILLFILARHHVLDMLRPVHVCAQSRCVCLWVGDVINSYWKAVWPTAELSCMRSLLLRTGAVTKTQNPTPTGWVCLNLRFPSSFTVSLRVWKPPCGCERETVTQHTKGKTMWVSSLYQGEKILRANLPVVMWELWKWSWGLICYRLTINFSINKCK